MYLSLWRRLRDRNPAPAVKGRRARPHSSRPRLEALEDRLPPTLGAAGALVLAAPQSAVTRLAPPVSPEPGGAKPIAVTVAQGTARTVIDLGRVFAGVGGLDHKDGLKLSVLGNTNSKLVTTALSEAALTLTYAAKMWGTATITVGATDADGVSVQQDLLVRVQAVSPPVTLVVSPVSVKPLVAPSPGPSR
jgi:hypothetical protein